MSNAVAELKARRDDLAQMTVRIRKDQRDRLHTEQHARGLKLADVVRDNLDLAFAMKEELSKIVEGDFDDNDPSNTPRLVHSLLFRVEERILAGLDNLAGNIIQQFAALAGRGENGVQPDNVNDATETVERFISLIADTDEHSREVWVGAFLEIVPRLELVGAKQLTELAEKGRLWLEEREAPNS